MRSTVPERARSTTSSTLTGRPSLFPAWYASAESLATVSEALAESYYQQSIASLERAHAAAKRATELAPENGYAWTRLAVAVPMSGALSGFIQARCKFCAGYGMAGLQNMGRLGEQQRVEDQAARRADRLRALRIHAVSIAGGLLVAVGFWRLRV